MLRGGGCSCPLTDRLAVLSAQAEPGLRRPREPGACCLQVDHGACSGRLGLDVTTEARADDGAWVADVLVRHPGWTVALEAQLSRIPLAALEDRQQRYRDAGISGAWLVGYDIAGHEARRDLPVFRLEVKQGERLEPAVIGSPTAGAPGRTELGKFTRELLTGRVHAAMVPGQGTP